MEPVTWTRPSFCDSGSCLEVKRRAPGDMIIRNNQAPEIFIAATADEWDVFIRAAKAGEFDA